MARKWTQEEIDFVEANYQEMSSHEIAERLPGRTYRSVQHLASNRGLKKEVGVKPGDVFHYLTITSEPRMEFSSQEGVRCSVVDAQCKCGNKVVAAPFCRLKSGHTKSCGCLVKEKARKVCEERNTTHGKSQHPLYEVWSGMKKRCQNSNCSSYHNYGGRGIEVCDEWDQSFEDFFDWAINNGWKQGLTIDRENNDGHYHPDNCRWATRKEQSINTRVNRRVKAWGETKTLAEWVDDPRCIVSYMKLLSRLNAGFPPEDAMSKKIVKKYLTISAFGETKKMYDWSLDERCQCSYVTLYHRINRGWEPERAIITPNRKRDK